MITKKPKVILIYLLLIVLSVVYFLPYYLITTAAFKRPVEIFSLDKLVLFQPTLINFVKAVEEYQVHLALRNSVIVMVPTTILVVVIALLAAYPLARFKFRGREAVALDILSLRMMPAVVTVIPLFLLASAMELTNTYWILILVNTVFNLPLAIWLMKTFIEDVPIEIEEAASIDGAGRLTTLLKIVFPVLANGMIATAVLTSIFVWNEFLFAVVLTGGIETKTLPVVAASAMKTRYIAWGDACAIGLIATLPLLVLFAIVQKYLLRALTFGLVR